MSFNPTPVDGEEFVNNNGETRVWDDNRKVWIKYVKTPELEANLENNYATTTTLNAVYATKDIVGAIHEVYVDANGKVSGYRAISTGDISKFQIYADTFEVFDPDASEGYAPFIVDTTNHKIKLNSNVYIGGELIVGGSIPLDSLESKNISNFVNDSNFVDTTDLATKNSTFIGSEEPTAISIGDTWIDTSNNNEHLVWSGSEWNSVRDLEIAKVSASAVEAQNLANDALSKADLAQATADGAIRTYYQAEAPEDLNDTTDVGDLWFDTDTNQANRWNGTEWLLIEDNEIATALEAAQNAQTTADGKIVSYYGDTEPTNPGTGDLWFKSNENNKPYYYDGSDWVSVRDLEIENASIAASNAQTSANDALSKADLAQATADGKIETYYQDDAPEGLNDTSNVGDLWFNTNTNQASRWDGSNWVLLDDKTIGEALNAAQNAQTTADGKIVSYYGDTEPTNPGTGDLWFKSNENNKPYYYDGADWVEVQDKTIQIAQQTADEAALTAVWDSVTGTGKPHNNADVTSDSSQPSEWLQGNSKTIATIDTEGWYRIAVNEGNRALAKFIIRDIEGGRHNTAVFYLGCNYNRPDHSTFSLVSYNRYSSQTISKVRLLTNGTYDDQYVEVYISNPDGSNDGYICNITENLQITGWDPVGWSVGEIPEDYSVKEFSIDDSHVVDSTANSDFVTAIYPADKSSLQNQIDGKVESWFQDSDPSENWTSPDSNHSGDMWWNTNTNKLKRYSGSSWSEDLTDQTAIAAYNNAVNAQSTADGKAVVFTSTPDTPYDVGDLWDAGGDPRILKRCISARSSGDFESGDWTVLANEVTNTNQISDDAGLGSKAVWENVTGTGKPTDNADVTNYSDIRIDNDIIKTAFEGENLNLTATFTSSVDIDDARLSDGILVIGSPYTSIDSNEQWIQADFGENKFIGDSRLYFYAQDGRTYSYKLAYSENGADWNYLSDYKQSRSNIDGYCPVGITLATIDNMSIFARYVRVYIDGNTTNNSNHLYEWEILTTSGNPDAYLEEYTLYTKLLVNDTTDITNIEIKNINPLFNEWDGDLPVGYGAWNTKPLKENNIVKTGRSSLRFVVDADEDSGLNIYNPVLFPITENDEYLTVTINILSISGTFAGSGVRLDYVYKDSDDNYIRKYIYINFNLEVPTPEANKWYTITKVVKRPEEPDLSVYPFLALDGYIMGHYSGMNGGISNPIDMVVDSLLIRKASDGEIKAYESTVQLDEMSSDSKITPVEKLALVKKLNEITNEKQPLIDRASSVSVSSTVYNDEYNNLKNYVDTLNLNDLSLSTSITKSTFDSKFDNYYIARGNLEKDISDKVNSNISIKIDAGELNAALDNNILTPNEKPIIIQANNEIYNEKNNFETKLSRYKVDNTNYVLNNIDLVNFLHNQDTPVKWDDLSDITNIDNKLLVERFSSVYDERDKYIEKLMPIAEHFSDNVKEYTNICNSHLYNGLVAATANITGTNKGDISASASTYINNELSISFDKVDGMIQDFNISDSTIDDYITSRDDYIDFVTPYADGNDHTDVPVNDWETKHNDLRDKVLGIKPICVSTIDSYYSNTVIPLKNNLTIHRRVADTTVQTNYDRTSIKGNRITTGTLDASVVKVVNLDASHITTGILTADVIESGSLTKMNTYSISGTLQDYNGGLDFDFGPATSTSNSIHNMVILNLVIKNHEEADRQGIFVSIKTGPGDEDIHIEYIEKTKVFKDDDTFSEALKINTSIITIGQNIPYTCGIYIVDYDDGTTPDLEVSGSISVISFNK